MNFKIFFFLKLKVLLVAKYHRKSFALTSLISSQWAFKKILIFRGKKSKNQKFPIIFPRDGRERFYCTRGFIPMVPHRKKIFYQFWPFCSTTHWYTFVPENLLKPFNFNCLKVLGLHQACFVFATLFC